MITFHQSAFPYTSHFCVTCLSQKSKRVGIFQYVFRVRRVSKSFEFRAQLCIGDSFTGASYNGICVGICEEISEIRTGPIPIQERVIYILPPLPFLSLRPFPPELMKRPMGAFE